MLEKMDEFFEKRLSGYDEHMLTEIEAAGEFYRFTAEQLPKNADCRLLDLGCGTGLELGEYFKINPTAQVTAIDLSEAMLGAMREKFPDKKIQTVHGSYFDVPFGNERYDGAVSVESLHHFTADMKESLYKKLLSALKDGGYFILTDYFAESEELEREYRENYDRLKRQQGIADNEFYHYDTPLTKEHERDILKNAGFSDVLILKGWGATYTLKATKGER
ncbi:MAG: methyltransferase domain-containing protein [Oscillospiraceae bacterium]|nr:methyltransferase domain-containing protein [Oscillospiraceae bacterium]